MSEPHEQYEDDEDDAGIDPYESSIEDILTKDDEQQEKIQRRFQRWLRNGDTKACLEMLKTYFDTHLPSMPASGYEPLKAAYLDGQKSVFLEIDDIVAGKYRETRKNTNPNT